MATRFLDLTDTPNSYAGKSGNYLKVVGNKIQFVDISYPASTSNFIDFPDTPANYGTAGQYLRWNDNVGSPALEWANFTNNASFQVLTDTPGMGAQGQYLKTNFYGELEWVDYDDTHDTWTTLYNVTPLDISPSTADKWVKLDGTGEIMEYTDESPIGLDVKFTDLTDTPSSYTGESGKTLRVFVDGPTREIRFDTALTNPSGFKTTFLGMSDTPASYSGSANYLLKASGGAIVFEQAPSRVAKTFGVFSFMAEKPQRINYRISNYVGGSGSTKNCLNVIAPRTSTGSGPFGLERFKVDSSNNYTASDFTLFTDDLGSDGSILWPNFGLKCNIEGAGTKRFSVNWSFKFYQYDASGWNNVLRCTTRNQQLANITLQQWRNLSHFTGTLGNNTYEATGSTIITIDTTTAIGDTQRFIELCYAIPKTNVSGYQNLDECYIQALSGTMNIIEI